MFDVAVICLVLTALLAYINKRFIGLPTVIGVMAIALLLSFLLMGLDKLGVGHLRDYATSMLASIDFSNLLLQTRINAETVQKQHTSDLMFDCPSIVKYVSQWVTLHPGDVIYTGTPGNTKKMNPGDTVEVEIEGIGVLRNRVV